MKKIGLFLLLLAAAFGFTACGKKKKSVNPDDYITPDVQGNLIKNGNFNSGEVETASSGDQFIGNWWCYNLNGGAGRMGITDMHELEIMVMKESQAEHCIQVAYDGFKIFKENKYTLEFDAYATYNRKLEVRVQMNGSPYTNYMYDGGVKKEDTIVQLGKKKQHYKFEFTSKVQDKSPRLVLNCGWFEGDKLVEKPAYKVDKNTNEVILIPSESIFFDNVTLICNYDAGIREDPLNRPMITLNQVGFMPGQVKEAVFRKDPNKALDTAYTINDATTKEAVYSGSVTALEGKNESSNETCGYADFTAFATPGKYIITGNNSGESYAFEIKNDVYDKLANDTIMMLYKQRCGEVLGESGDKFAHGACHQDRARIYGESATSTIDVSGGWHDAGDYGKYVVAGAQTVSDLLDTYNIYGDVFQYDSYVTGTDASTPDILEEAMWELDWMLKMQKSNGEVYHKVTTLSFPENTVKPTDDKATLYVCPTSYAATADFAAVMAKAYNVLKNHGYVSTKTEGYKAAAIDAYEALSHMSKTSFKNPNDINYGQVSTGEYPDDQLDDEFNWASIELYFATGDDSYLTAFTNNISKITELGLGWANVDGFAVESYLMNMEASDPNYSAETRTTLTNMVLDLADEFVANSKKDVYNITLGKKMVDGKSIYQFEWGSNLTIANNAMILDFASYLTSDTAKEAEYKLTLQKQVNYLLGQNANCYCFVTGYGTLSPENPHHRPSIIAKEAMPGMLVGGPDSNFAENGNDAIATNNCEDEAPALCYIDHNNSWSTNEVTIYWNSPFTYVMYAAMNNN